MDFVNAKEVNTQVRHKLNFVDGYFQSRTIKLNDAKLMTSKLCCHHAITFPPVMVSALSFKIKMNTSIVTYSSILQSNCKYNILWLVVMPVNITVIVTGMVVSGFFLQSGQEPRQFFLSWPDLWQYEQKMPPLELPIFPPLLTVRFLHWND
jgi:hypothetical protein